MAPLAILGMVIFMWIGGSVVMLLWNWLAPTLFGLRLITFWQAIGLLALCRILFGGFGLGAVGIAIRAGEWKGEYASECASEWLSAGADDARGAGKIPPGYALTWRRANDAAGFELDCMNLASPNIVVR